MSEPRNFNAFSRTRECVTRSKYFPKPPEVNSFVKTGLSRAISEICDWKNTFLEEFPILFLFGHRGSGKSSLARHAMGLTHDIVEIGESMGSIKFENIEKVLKTSSMEKLFRVKKNCIVIENVDETLGDKKNFTRFLNLIRNFNSPGRIPVVCISTVKEGKELKKRYAGCKLAKFLDFRGYPKWITSREIIRVKFPEVNDDQFDRAYIVSGNDLSNLIQNIAMNGKGPSVVSQKDEYFSPLVILNNPTIPFDKKLKAITSELRYAFDLFYSGMYHVKGLSIEDLYSCTEKISENDTLDMGPGSSHDWDVMEYKTSNSVLGPLGKLLKYQKISRGKKLNLFRKRSPLNISVRPVRKRKFVYF